MKKILNSLLSKLLALSFFAIDIGWANLQVLPTRIVLNDNTKLTTVFLRNKESTSKEYMARLTYYQMDSSGKMVEISDVKGKLDSLIDYVSFSPKRVRLNPGEEQTIRLKISPPANLLEGDYRCHIKFSPVEESTGPSTIESTSGINLNLRPQVSVAVPVFFTKGRPLREFEIKDFRLEENNGGLLLKTQILNSASNTILTGNIKVSLIDPVGGTEESIYQVNSINSYISSYPIRLKFQEPEKIKKMKGKFMRISFERTGLGSETLVKYADQKL